MRKPFFILVTLVLIAVLLVAEIFVVKNASEFEPKTGVVFAARQIPEEAEITQDMIEQRDVSISYAHRLSVTDISRLQGMVAGCTIEEGEMILTSRVEQINAGERIEVQDADKRLFTVEFKPDQANGWSILPGTNVDIIYIPRDESCGDVRVIASELPEFSAYTIEGIRVAEVLDDKGRVYDEKSGNTVPKYICFEVTSRQAEFLAYAKGNGRLEIAAIP